MSYDQLAQSQEANTFEVEFFFLMKIFFFLAPPFLPQMLETHLKRQVIVLQAKIGGICCQDGRIWVI